MILFKKQNKGNGLPHFLGAKKENKRFFERGFAGDFDKKVRKEYFGDKRLMDEKIPSHATIVCLKMGVGIR